MNREQRIADLVLHGYVPYENAEEWVAIWSEERGEGSMCKFFADGQDGPGWDVRWIISGLALMRFDEVLWMCITDDQLAQLTLPEPPPKFRHHLPDPTKADPFGQREYIDP